MQPGFHFHGQVKLFLACADFRFQGLENLFHVLSVVLVARRIGQVPDCLDGLQRIIDALVGCSDEFFAFCAAHGIAPCAFRLYGQVLIARSTSTLTISAGKMSAEKCLSISPVV